MCRELVVVDGKEIDITDIPCISYIPEDIFAAINDKRTSSDGEVQGHE